MELGDSKELGVIVASLQASQIAQATMLQVMIATHPDPDALKRAWNALVPARAASALQEKVSQEAGGITNHFLLESYQDWTGYLDKYSAKR